ncbi:hypothetical protein OOT46_19095 [Aquabacterium sp. A7-Y]|uniref:hypothetical protein n=1 Tax=Aquabacterium sp. A7-Y TaxID=1349605 RepID=UPI00223CFA9E|nr:hypothetical protein [Aquabacterium sp. A7-Y]MCW7539947.1 hypothetical protein [Aquabacterium sp. A7-Y]
MSDLLDPDLVYAKTDAGRHALRERNFLGTHGQRALFILIDGRQPLRRLGAAIRSLGLGLSDVQALLDRAYVEVVGPARGLVREVAAAPISVDIETDAPLAAARSVTRSLAAAKFYALEQIGRMPGQGDAALRQAARDVRDRESLLRWLEDCKRHLQQVAGEERARLFLARSLELLPEEEALDRG